MSEASMRLVSVLGFVTMIGIAWLSSTNRSRFPVRTVAWGVGLAFVVFQHRVVREFFLDKGG